MNCANPMTDYTDYPKRTWARVDLDAVRHNYRVIRESLSPGARIMAIVKADAYGHGAGYVSRALRDEGVTWFGVSNLDEALQIRQEGIDGSLLILGFTPPQEAAVLGKYNITQTVFTKEYAEKLSREAVKAGITINVHIKFDTGMSRIGFFCQNDAAIVSAAGEAEEVCALPGLNAVGAFTHFASADEQDDGGYTREQFGRFQRVLALLEERGVHFALRHCCNSAACMRYPEMHLDMVRPGLILYGLAPDKWMEGMLPLKPAMELKTVISMTKTVPAGTPASYGRIFTAEAQTALATVPIGYADGYPRCMSNRAQMLIHGRRADVVGRVCMDQCLLNITGIEGVHEGDTVTVFGRDSAAELPVEEFAALCGTINYEIVCLIGKRVPRIFESAGHFIGRLNYISPDDEWLNK